MNLRRWTVSYFTLLRVHFDPQPSPSKIHPRGHRSFTTSLNKYITEKGLYPRVHYKQKLQPPILCPLRLGSTSQQLKSGTYILSQQHIPLGANTALVTDSLSCVALIVLSTQPFLLLVPQKPQPKWTPRLLPINWTSFQEFPLQHKRIK